jgi:manganese transport protein
MLSIALPLPMISLLIFTRRKDVMGEFVNRRLTNGAAMLGAAVVLALNGFLIWEVIS